MITVELKYETKPTTPKYPYVGIIKNNGTMVPRSVVLFLYSGTGLLLAKYQPDVGYISNTSVDKDYIYLDRYEESEFEVFEGEVTLKNA